MAIHNALSSITTFAKCVHQFSSLEQDLGSNIPFMYWYIMVASPLLVVPCAELLCAVVTVGR